MMSCPVTQNCTPFVLFLKVLFLLSPFLGGYFCGFSVCFLTVPPFFLFFTPVVLFKIPTLFFTRFPKKEYQKKEMKRKEIVLTPPLPLTPPPPPPQNSFFF
eukprot:Hpha_TRINITY_DN14652_c0_g1::TRINITY_DN14652_c0_g1_i1::g.48648::m.48648